MRVLIQNRPNMFKVPGGDTVQLLKTKEKLENLGVEVDVTTEIYPKNIDKYDIVHIFNVTRINECYLQFWNAKKMNKKIVISPIYHSKEQLDEYEKKALRGIVKILKNFLKNNEILEIAKAFFRVLKNISGFKGLIKQIFIGYTNMQKNVLLNADMILPNSQMELEFIERELGLKIDKRKVRIIPNAVEIGKEVDQIDKNIFFSKFGVTDFVFCVGRIEPLKNQLGIIEALKDTKYKIVFAGKLNKKHKKYCKEFLNKVENNENIYYVDQLAENMLFSAYRNAKVTVISSWFETTGLVGLEAAKMGSNLVITEKGYTRDYYGDYVEYCSPDDHESILKAIEKTYNKPVNDTLIEKLNDDFNWDKTGMLTKYAYDDLMSGVN
ncbi:glycosyltransferase [Clostridium tertium]|uniref:glycosyltransferase n=1 Tax=Clostridium tertium TaxID=1559 RepID=UPI003DA30A9D